MPTAPPTITAPPPAPARTSPSTFPALADAWVEWLETAAPNIGDAADATHDNAIEAHASNVSAIAAAASVAATLWVSGTTYTTGDVRRSPITYFSYRRLTDGAGTTDPSADTTNWALAVAAAPVLIDVTGTSANAQAWGHYRLTNSSATTLTLPASPAAGDAIYITVSNGRADNVVVRNGNNIAGFAENLTLNIRYGTVMLRYGGVTKGWEV